MTPKRIQMTRQMLLEYRNDLQDMAYAIEEAVDYSCLPAYAACDLAEKLYKAQRDIEELKRQFETALTNGDL